MMHWYRPIANFYQIQVSVSMLTTIFCCWAFGEIVVDKGDREEHKMEKVVTNNWGMDKSAATDIIFICWTPFSHPAALSPTTILSTTRARVSAHLELS